MNKVFVYGSLLSGLGNHGLLVESTKLGETKSPKLFSMVDLGWFPGVILNNDNPIEIKGEVYEVDENTLKRLDRLEGFVATNPKFGMYDRLEIDTEFGKAYIYVYNNIHKNSRNFVESGDWKTYFKTKLPNR